MDNKPVDEVVADAAPPKWRTLVRQQSQKIGTFAENVVLPRSERLERRAAESGGMSMGNVETQYPHPSTAYLYPNVLQSKKFPAFMFGISVFQIILYFFFDESLLLLIFGYDPHRRHEIWRFITLMFAHKTVSPEQFFENRNLNPSAHHLWNNIGMQLLLGTLLEMVHGWKRIAIIYLASVLGGSLCISVIDKTYVVGASAGVYGLLFSHLATIILNWNEMEKKVYELISLLLYMAYDLALALVKKDSHISHAGHAGGAVTGFLVSILVLKNFKKHPWEKKMQKICATILIALCGIVFLVNTAGWRYFVPTEWNFQYGETYLKDFFNSVNKSSKLSVQCEKDEECKQQLDQFKFNGTISK